MKLQFKHQKFQADAAKSVVDVLSLIHIQLKTEAAGESLKESIIRDEQKRVLQKQIANLQGKIRKEKQLNKQMQINSEIKKLKKELEDM